VIGISRTGGEGGISNPPESVKRYCESSGREAGRIYTDATWLSDVDSARSVFLGPELLVGSVFAGPDFPGLPGCPGVGSAVSASFGLVLLVGPAFVGPDFQVCPGPNSCETTSVI
jgi:hypothetical protein